MNMKRTDIINIFIEKLGYKSYLEIGTQKPSGNFNHINAEYKFCIEPFPSPSDMDKINFIGTSDEYFQSITDDIKFDIIFIDGLHHDNQVLKDIKNSLNHLSNNGVIICHDCLPTTEKMQEREDHGGEWTGDVWKAIAKLRKERTDLDIRVVDTDYGCGIIRRGINQPYNVTNKEDYLSYNYFKFFKYEMLNVITPNQFLEWINSQ
jgi:hypothetical protein